MTGTPDHWTFTVKQIRLGYVDEQCVWTGLSAPGFAALKLAIDCLFGVEKRARRLLEVPEQILGIVSGLM